MKFFVVLCFAALAFGRPQGPSSNSSKTIIEMIENYGYSAEAKTVITDDGYVLQLFRIPGGRRDNTINRQQQQQQSIYRRTPVFLMHGMMSSAEDWIYGGPTQSLAFMLADRGNDVYLGSARGSRHGLNHTKLDPENDRAFWDFSFDDIGTHDMPALINAALEWNGQQNARLNVVAHMAGTTAFLVMASERSEMNSKIDQMVALGPMAYMKQSTETLLQQVVPNLNSKSWLMKNLGMAALKLSSNLDSTIQTDCANRVPKSKRNLCNNAYFMINGFNSNQLNMTTLEKDVLPNVPSGCSAMEIIHFAQLVQSGRFQKYTPLNQNDNDAREYDLSKVTVPLSFFYAPNDAFSQTDDVQRLIKKLPNVKKNQLINSITNNLDLLWSENVESINDAVIRVLSNEQQSYNGYKSGESSSNSNESDMSA